MIGDGRPPCLASDAEVGGCIVGLLLGVACCSDGDCALCRAESARLRRDGVPEQDRARRLVERWYAPVEPCPWCGRGVARLAELEPMPRFARTLGNRFVSGVCLVCDRPLGPDQRRFCGDDCMLERRRNVEGWGFGRFEPVPRVYRISTGRSG